MQTMPNIRASWQWMTSMNVPSCTLRISFPYFVPFITKFFTIKWCKSFKIIQQHIIHITNFWSAKVLQNRNIQSYNMLVLFVYSFVVFDCFLFFQTFWHFKTRQAYVRAVNIYRPYNNKRKYMLYHDYNIKNWEISVNAYYHKYKSEEIVTNLWCFVNFCCCFFFCIKNAHFPPASVFWVMWR